MATRKKPHRAQVPPVLAAPKTWTDREVLDLVRAVLVVRDSGLMRRIQAVWSGSDSAGLSPLSEFFRDQERRYDLFGFKHEAAAQFWSRISAALESRERATEKVELTRHVREILLMARSHRAAALAEDPWRQAWVARQGRYGGGA